MLEIIYEQPPFISEAREIFRLPEGVIFTWGKKIFNPSHKAIDEPLFKHEECHSKQQGEYPDVWWSRYLKDIDFRLSQEIPAYQIQFKSAKEFIKDKNKLNTYLISLASDLSGQMYGSIMSFSDAFEAIKREQLYEFKTEMYN